jgi:hypothetical protein
LGRVVAGSALGRNRRARRNIGRRKMRAAETCGDCEDALGETG